MPISPTFVVLMAFPSAQPWPPRVFPKKKEKKKKHCFKNDLVQYVGTEMH